VTGEVDVEGRPILVLSVASQDWIAMIDTGFNGDLELPDSLATFFAGTFFGRVRTALAGGQFIWEKMYKIVFPFDGQTVKASVTYVPSTEILIGTNLIKDYKLEIDFPNKTVQLTRLQGP